MQIVTGRRGEPHVTSRQMQAVYRSFLGDFALLDIGEKLRAEAYSNDIVRVYDGVVSVQGIYAVIAYNQYDEVYIEPVSVGKKRIDTIVLHYTKDNALDVEDMQLDVVQGEEYTDNPIAPVVPEGGDAWEGTTDIQVPIYDVEVTNFGLTVTPYARMLNLIPTLESIAERIPETVVTGVKGDSEVLYRDGNVNITKANIGLGNVDNTADTDKPISTATQTALNLKADLTYVDAKISAAYHAGGNLTVAALTSALLIADNMGKVYNMSDSGVTTSDFVEGAGEPIHEGDNVGICNVGTEESPVYKFDLLSGFVDLSAYATTSAVNAGLEGKVDKVAGKGLSTEDYTTIDKTKLAGISEGATQTIANPADTATETLSKLEVGGVVYDVPQGTTGATNLSELNDVNLSGTVEGDILEYDSTANKWKNSNALQGAKTATGNPITVTDCAPVNAVDVSVDVEPVQDLHGYDHPWVGGAGKNLLPMTVEAIKAANTSGTWSGNAYTVNGVTFTIQTDSEANVTGINANGTASDIVAFILAESVSATQNCILTGGKSADMCIQSRYTTQPFDWVPDNGSPNGTVVAMERPRLIFIYIDNSTSVNSQLFKPMLRLSTETDSTFAPYTNICPISGRSEVAIQREGKNLFDKNGTQTATYGTATIDGEKITCTGTYYARIALDLPAGIYTVSCEVLSFSTSKGIRLFYDDNTYSDKVMSSRTINTNGKRVVAVLLYCGEGTSATTVYQNIQIEKGNTATTYEPFTSDTYTIQLGNTVYGGTLDVTRGKMVVDKGYAEFDGSSDENWSRLGGSTPWGDYTMYISLNGVKYDDGDTTPNILSNYLRAIPFNPSWASYDAFLSKNPNSDAIYTGIKSITTVADWKTYLASNPLHIVYELATPFTIQLTPQQIKLLENTNTIYTDYEGDTITIEYQPNNTLGQLKGNIEDEYDERVETLENQTQELLPSLTFMSRERRNITSDLGRLSTAVAEQNLAKYGYKIGDYFTGASGYTYTLADYDTFKGTSTPYCLTQNHLGIVVDTHQTSQWYSGDASSVGYNGSTLHTYLKGTVMDNIKVDMIALFGGSTGLEHLLPHSKLFTTALANWAWQANQYISALTCTQIDAGSQWTANGFQEGEASKSLELFRKYKWTEIFGGEYPWLRDLSNYGTGGSFACGADSHGHLAGYVGMAASFVVVGLINFY